MTSMTESKDRDLEEDVKILWKDEWGIPKAQMSAADAEQQCLTLIRGRWVSKDRARNILCILRARASVKFASLWAFAIAGLWIVVFVPFFISYGSNPHPMWVGIVPAIIVSLIASAIAVRWYARWAYVLIMVLYTIVVTVLAVAIVPAIGVVSKSSQAIPAWIIALSLIMLSGTALSLYRLAQGPVRNIFRKDMQQALRETANTRPAAIPSDMGIVLFVCTHHSLRDLVGSMFRRDMHRAVRETTRPRTLLRTLGYGSLGLAFLLIGALTIGYWSSYQPIRPVYCDRAASATAAKLGAALERLANERSDAHCPITPETLKKDLRLEYLVGPYYGWAGTHEKAEVLVRIVGDEVWACSRLGSHPTEDQDVRWVYRVSILGGTDLPAEFGKCEGSSYGGPDDYCYTSSMLGDDCRIREPEVKKPCREIRNSDEK